MYVRWMCMTLDILMVIGGYAVHIAFSRGEHSKDIA